MVSAIDPCIVNIVRTHAIKEQSELQRFLKKYGYDVPQATLSRHLRKLKISKLDGVYQVMELYPSALPTILTIQVADSGLIVIHTYPGQANSIARFIDEKYVVYTFPSKSVAKINSSVDSGANFDANVNTGIILGTIAGDDTILVIVRTKKHVAEVLKMLRRDFSHAHYL